MANRGVKGTVTASSGVNLRDEPSSLSDKVGGVDYGETVRVTCVKEGGWGHVSWPLFETGNWVALQYVALEKPVHPC